MKCSTIYSAEAVSDKRAFFSFARQSEKSHSFRLHYQCTRNARLSGRTSGYITMSLMPFEFLPTYARVERILDHESRKGSSVFVFFCRHQLWLISKAWIKCWATSTNDVDRERKCPADNQCHVKSWNCRCSLCNYRKSFHPKWPKSVRQ